MDQRLWLWTAAAIVAAGLGTTPANAASEDEIGFMRQACSAGDHEACLQFGSALRGHHEREWRRMHEDWYR